MRHGSWSITARGKTDLLVGGVTSCLAMQYDSAEGKGKEQAKQGLDKARAKSDKFRGRVEEAGQAAPPKVEVCRPPPPNSNSNHTHQLCSADMN